MAPKLIVHSALMLLVLGMFAVTVSAQQVELYPNAGGFWPRSTDTYGDFKNEGIYGLKGGVFLDENLELEGSFGYINHFELRSQPSLLNNARFGIGSPTIHGFLYDVNGSWNFGQRDFFGARVTPYVTGGAGGLTTEVRHADRAFIFGNAVVNPAGVVVPTGRTVLMEDGDTFLTINYGGGIKAMNLWGPMGLRADIRGRTLPNFFGEALTWPELTGGVIFTFGKR